MARRPSEEKMLVRNLCLWGLQNMLAKNEFQARGQRLEVSIVNDLTLQVKVFGKGNPLPAYLTVTVRGNI